MNDPIVAAPTDPPVKKTISSAIGGKLKTYFFAGILVTAPVGITIYIAWSVVDFVDQHVTPLLPLGMNPDRFMPINFPGFGLLVLLVGLTLIGAITTNVLGGFLVKLGDTIFARTPVIRGLYGLLKQMVEMLVGEKQTAFRQVVMVPYPNEDSWAIGFLTGTSYQAANQIAGQDLVSVFVPLPPNPTAGLLLYYPRAKVKNLPIAVEDGWKLILSTGVVLPQSGKGANRIASN